MAAFPSREGGVCAVGAFRRLPSRPVRFSTGNCLPVDRRTFATVRWLTPISAATARSAAMAASARSAAGIVRRPSQTLVASLSRPHRQAVIAARLLERPLLDDEIVGCAANA